jgi:hypothetical protein
MKDSMDTVYANEWIYMHYNMRVARNLYSGSWQVIDDNTKCLHDMCDSAKDKAGEMSRLGDKNTCPCPAEISFSPQVGETTKYFIVRGKLTQAQQNHLMKILVFAKSPLATSSLIHEKLFEVEGLRSA